MIIHLETGCSSIFNELYLGRSVALCFQWKQFIIHSGLRHALVDGQDVFALLIKEFGSRYCIYKCPCCESAFWKLSSLFMHVESPACDAELGDGVVGKLQKWLENRTGHGSTCRYFGC